MYALNFNGQIQGYLVNPCIPRIYGRSYAVLYGLSGVVRTDTIDTSCVSYCWQRLAV